MGSCFGQQKDKKQHKAFEKRKYKITDNIKLQPSGKCAEGLKAASSFMLLKVSAKGCLPRPESEEFQP